MIALEVFSTPTVANSEILGINWESMTHHGPNLAPPGPLLVALEQCLRSLRALLDALAVLSDLGWLLADSSAVPSGLDCKAAP